MTSPVLRDHHHWVFHAKISLNSKFLRFFPFPSKVINIWPFWGNFGSLATLWRHWWVYIFKIFKIEYHHWTFHAKSSLNATFLLFIPFQSAVISIWRFLGTFRGPPRHQPPTNTDQYRPLSTMSTNSDWSVTVGQWSAAGAGGDLIILHNFLLT